MKYVKCLLAISIVSLSAGCVTNGNYCDIAKTIHHSRQDILTEKTKSQLVENNLTYEKLCKGRKK